MGIFGNDFYGLGINSYVIVNDVEIFVLDRYKFLKCWFDNFDFLNYEGK